MTLEAIEEQSGALGIAPRSPAGPTSDEEMDLTPVTWTKAFSL